MKKSHLFWLVFIVATIFSYLIGISLTKDSFMNDVGRYQTYSSSNEIWEHDFKDSPQGIVVVFSIIVGLIVGGISTLFKPSSKDSN